MEFNMLKSFQKLTNAEFDNILSTNWGHDTRLTADEREKVNELIGILEQLFKFTNILQSDGVTISYVVPALRTVLLLHNIDLPALHNKKMAKDPGIEKEKFYFESLIKIMKETIKKRFEKTFCSPLHFFSAIFYPNYETSWLSNSEKIIWLEKLKRIIKNLESNTPH